MTKCDVDRKRNNHLHYVIHYDISYDILVYIATCVIHPFGVLRDYLTQNEMWDFHFVRHDNAFTSAPPNDDVIVSVCICGIEAQTNGSK